MRKQFIYFPFPSQTFCLLTVRSRLLLLLWQIRSGTSKWMSHGALKMNRSQHQLFGYKCLLSHRHLGKWKNSTYGQLVFAWVLLIYLCIYFTFENDYKSIWESVLSLSNCVLYRMVMVKGGYYTHVSEVTW